MGNIVELKTLPPLPPDTPERLRKMANDIEAGRITAIVVGYIMDGEYNFMWPSPLIDSLTISTLAQATALDRLRR